MLGIVHSENSDRSDDDADDPNSNLNEQYRYRDKKDQFGKPTTRSEPNKKVSVWVGPGLPRKGWRPIGALPEVPARLCGPRIRIRRTGVGHRVTVDARQSVDWYDWSEDWSVD